MNPLYKLLPFGKARVKVARNIEVCWRNDRRYALMLYGTPVLYESPTDALHYKVTIPPNAVLPFSRTTNRRVNHVLDGSGFKIATHRGDSVWLIGMGSIRFRVQPGDYIQSSIGYGYPQFTLRRSDGQYVWAAFNQEAPVHTVTVDHETTPLTPSPSSLPAQAEAYATEVSSQIRRLFTATTPPATDGWTLLSAAAAAQLAEDNAVRHEDLLPTVSLDELAAAHYYTSPTPTNDQ